MDNPFGELEIASVEEFSRWQKLWAWVFRRMTGMKIGLLYRREK